MRYQGGKARLGKYILTHVLRGHRPGSAYVEPFVGGCNTFQLTAHLPAGTRFGYDVNPYLIAMWSALVEKRWMPPKFASFELYKSCKANPEQHPPELVGYVGHLTIGAGFFHTYARYQRGSNFSDRQIWLFRSHYEIIVRVRPLLVGGKFDCMSFEKIRLPKKPSTIYCDPPYASTETYGDRAIKQIRFGAFNHDLFYDWCVQASEAGHRVFISEYRMPSDRFKMIDKWSITKCVPGRGRPRKAEEALWVPR